MTREPFYESNSEARWWVAITGRALLIGVIVLVFAVVAALGTLGWRYFIAGPTGKVQKTEIIQSGRNQLTQQQAFEDLYAKVQTYGTQIQTAARQDLTDPNNRTILEGLENVCADTVNKYDALARTEQAEAFRAADLPPSLDVTSSCPSPK